MSDLTPSPLNLASTEDLIEELKTRFATMAITGLMKDDTTGNQAFFRDSFGDPFSTLGMMQMHMSDLIEMTHCRSKIGDDSFSAAQDFLRGLLPPSE